MTATTKSCTATRGGVVDRRGETPVTVPTYRCTRRAGHAGAHRDGTKGHRWA